MKKEDLKTFSGKDGKPAYISHKGEVYDVSGSRLWAGGIHMGRHSAGQDLTGVISQAPHGEDVLKRVKKIDDIIDESPEKTGDKKDIYREFYRKFHPHPILIHFPIGLFIFGAIMQGIFHFTGNDSFEKSAYYSIVFAALAVFPTVMSGFLSWWINYEMTMTGIFRNKIIFSLLLIISGVITVVLRTLYPDISIRPDQLSIAYNILLFLNVPFTGIIAYNGGKITWPS